MPRPQSVPTCLVVVPERPPESYSDSEWSSDPDGLFGHIERLVAAEGFICVRADFSERGGFVERSMPERLLIADLVIADVTANDPDVMYIIGVRQGVDLRPTILIGAGEHGRSTYAGSWTTTTVPYVIREDGLFDPSYFAEFEEAVLQRLHQVIDGDTHAGLPLLDATGWAVGGRLEHDKTDVFLERIATTSAIGSRIRTALGLSDRDESINALQALEHELLGTFSEIPELDTGLLGVYLGYRERAAYQHMVDLHPRMPPELQSTPVVREQLALALNRLAETSDLDAFESSAGELRSAALDSLDAVGSRAVTAETLAIRGRIYKGWFHAAVASGDDIEAAHMLDKAIETYEEAVRVDLRDYFPGINAITLRLTRGTPEDVEMVVRLVPVVRMAVENAPEANSEQERYWQIATKLELACAASDWAAAIREIESLVLLDVGHWMHETTIDNLNMYRGLFDQDIDSAEHLDAIVERLER